MDYFLSGVFGAWALTATFFSYLYLRDHQMIPVLVLLIGAVVGTGTCLAFRLTHS